MEPPAPVEIPEEPDPIPTFHDYADQWWRRNEKQLRPNTQTDYKIRLEKHLLPFFAGLPARPDHVRSRRAVHRRKLAEERPLSAAVDQHDADADGAILEGAVERELIPRNPAKGKQPPGPGA